MKRWIAFAALVSVLTACADSHQFIRIDGTAAKLAPEDAVLIAVPADGAYGANVYRGSGQNTAQILHTAFSRRTRLVRAAISTQSFDEALAAAKKGGQRYLVYSTILHWEDRATEWSGKADRVEVKIDIVDSGSGATVASGIAKGRSGLATFGGDHPQDLLPQPVEEFVASVY